jgi:signal transduction histidine kinase
MLDYSRARKVEKRKLNVNEFVEEMSQSFSDELAKRGVSCRLNFDEACPPLMLDVDGLHKALANLILNSLEACAEGTGQIELSTRLSEDGNLVLSVQDNAGGIPKEVMPRIFVPFFTTKGSKGSGLGLAMTKKIIEDMGGRIGVKSTEGVGTCFTITFLVGPASPKIAAPAKRSRKASH